MYHLNELIPALARMSSSRKETFTALIALQKTFDTVDRTLLKVFLLHRIDGVFCNSVKSIPGNTLSCARVIDLCTDWFFATAGLKKSITNPLCPIDQRSR